MLRLLLIGLLAAPPAFAQTAHWEKSWNAAVAAGKKEGSVVVAGFPDPVMRKEIIPRFAARFGIQVEFVAGRSSEIAARVRNERNAGLYVMDVFLAGPDTTAQVLYKERMLDPLRPLLMLPEVTDPSRWKNGKLWFADPEERYVLRPFSGVRSQFHINRDYVRPDDLRTAADLLQPRWRGKIASEDPATVGAGANKAGRFLLQMGEDFVVRLFRDQKPALSRERRQMADWLARGTHPICLNCDEDNVRPLQQEGFKIEEIFELPPIAPTINASPWLLTVAGRAPHPNAALVFANWIVSKEGLGIYSKGFGAPTLRRDVDESFLNPAAIPRAGVRYFDEAEWQWITTGRQEAAERVRKLLGAR
jgi:iron(III) transport system substrate-binding protein